MRNSRTDTKRSSTNWERRMLEYRIANLMRRRDDALGEMRLCKERLAALNLDATIDAAMKEEGK